MTKQMLGKFWEVHVVRTFGLILLSGTALFAIDQPQLSQQLLRSKVAALESGAPQVIATANIGCLHHIRGATSIPVRHWVELLAERLLGG